MLRLRFYVYGVMESGKRAGRARRARPVVEDEQKEVTWRELFRHRNIVYLLGSGKARKVSAPVVEPVMR